MINSTEQYNKISTACSTLVREWDKLYSQLNRMRDNQSIDKKTGETWGDKFNGQSLCTQLRQVWERVSQPQEIKGEREDGTRFDFVLPAWSAYELQRLAMIGKGARKLQDYDEAMTLADTAELLEIDEDDDSTDF